MMCSFLFFLLHPLFFLLSRKVSHFTLSHIWRYTGMQERSLGFARDDDTGKTTFQTCPLCEAKDIHSTFVRLRPPSRHFERSREILLALCSSLLLSQKVSHFPLSHIRHYPLLQERSLDFARDDVAEAALSKHFRCTLREINPFPHTVISSAARNLPCTLFFLAPFTEGFPFPAVAHMALYQCARKIPRLRSG